MRKLLILMLLALMTATARAEEITVSAAISLKEVLTQAAKDYSAQSGDTVQFNFGSSGQLVTQIRNGAPVDLLISAAQKQVDDLGQAKLVDASAARVVARNALVVIQPKDGAAPIRTLKDLSNDTIQRVAIGEPKTVPAGHYAEQALQHAGVYDAVKDRLVLGMNARQVLDYVRRGEVSAGLVYATDARVAGDKVHVVFEIDASQHDAILYPAVLINTSKKQKKAEKFVEFLLSDKGQSLLKEAGFAPGPAPATQPAK